jgi:hypothetical protein
MPKKGRKQMTALERIKEIDYLCNKGNGGIRSVNSNDVPFLLRAFNVMRKIAESQAECDQPASNPKDTIEVEFERRMNG